MVTSTSSQRVCACEGRGVYGLQSACIWTCKTGRKKLDRIQQEFIGLTCFINVCWTNFIRYHSYTFELTQLHIHTHSHPQGPTKSLNRASSLFFQTSTPTPSSYPVTQLHFAPVLRYKKFQLSNTDCTFQQQPTNSKWVDTKANAVFMEVVFRTRETGVSLNCQLGRAHLAYFYNSIIKTPKAGSIHLLYWDFCSSNYRLKY